MTGSIHDLTQFVLAVDAYHSAERLVANFNSQPFWENANLKFLALTHLCIRLGYDPANPGRPTVYEWACKRAQNIENMMPIHVDAARKGML